MSAVGGILAVFGVLAFIGAMAAAAFGQVSSFVWLIGVVAGVALMMVGLIYSMRFLLYPGLMLFAFAAGAALLTFVMGKPLLLVLLGVA